MRFLPQLIQHLWESTLFLGLVLTVLFLLRGRLTAGARFLLALVGIAKFAIPAAPAIGWMGRFFGHTTAAPLFVLPFEAAGVLRLDVAPAPETASPEAALVIWLGVAAVLMLRFGLTRHRLVRLAEKTALPAAPREVAALDRARRRVRVRRSIDIIRSGVPEAPAVLRTIRPVVVLPSAGCDELSDAELEALLCHECAHVRRHDNLIARIESFVCALFWFHPLIWIAQRVTAVERERACDEAVADSADERETYLTALAKFCHAAVVPRLPGISCMATARLKERMDHVENYERLRTHSPSPRRMLMISLSALVAYSIVAGIAADNRALAVGARAGDEPWAVRITAARDRDTIEVQGRVTDNRSGRVVATPKVTFPADREATARAGNTADGIDVTLHIKPADARRFTVDVTIDKSGSTVFQRAVLVTPSVREAQARFTGAPLTLDLENAELQDVIRTFGKLTGLTMEIDPSIAGTVSVNWVGVPWDQAFDELLAEHDLAYRLEGSTVHVTKQ